MRQQQDDPKGVHSATLSDAVELLLEAGVVLASSLDLETTMSQVARLTIPFLADLCVIDLRSRDGTISEAAVAAADAATAEELERLRARFPLDPDGPHPVARVIASGDPLLLREMSTMQLTSFAQGSEHARFMIAHGYASAIVAPLTARGRTLGALSVLRLGDSDRYGEEQLQLTCELARRAALAIDNALLFGEQHRLEERQDAILANLAEAITVEDATGRTVYANRAAADLLQLSSPEELIGADPGDIGARFLILDERGRELGPADMPGRRLFAGDPPEPLLVRNVVRATGEERWLNVRSSPVLDSHTGRLEYAVNVFENITGVKRAQLAESFMAQASRALASSMDYNDTLRSVARLAVPAIADWCAIDLLDEDGQLEPVTIHHRDPEKVALAERLRQQHRQSMDQEGGAPEVIRTGEPRIYTDIAPDALARCALETEQKQLLRAVAPVAVVIVPLTSGAGTIGAITLATSDSLRALSAVDVALAVRLGRRAGTAVANARMYAERSHIAHVLQRALLPERLIAIPGVELEARYYAAGNLNEVGGDFYDAFEHDGGWIVVLGDVVGKGPRAAGVTALARHTLRAAAMMGRSPTEMVALLHRALRQQPPGADMCTVCVLAVREQVGGELGLSVTLAGHPPPLVIDAAGAVQQVGRPGTLLGVLDPVRVHETEVALMPGQTILLYTDGVPDAGQPARGLGESGLLELCRSGCGLAPAQLLERVERATIEHAAGGLRDDLAMIALRRSGGSEGADG